MDTVGGVIRPAPVKQDGSRIGRRECATCLREGTAWGQAPGWPPEAMQRRRSLEWLCAAARDKLIRMEETTGASRGLDWHRLHAVSLSKSHWAICTDGQHWGFARGQRSRAGGLQDKLALLTLALASAVYGAGLYHWATAHSQPQSITAPQTQCCPCMSSNPASSQLSMRS